MGITVVLRTHLSERRTQATVARMARASASVAVAALRAIVLLLVLILGVLFFNAIFVPDRQVSDTALVRAC